MLLSRFWYVVLGLVLGGAVFVLFLATSMYNRENARAMGQGLSSDSQVVDWYLRDDARTRSGHLTKFALSQDIAKGLNESTKSESKIPTKARDSVEAALKKVNGTIPEDQAFDAVFAIDQHGRVVAHLGYEQASGMEDFELGGYPVVADALHGYIRDDTLVLDRLYRVVARPVEFEVGSRPAGAIVGARIIDDKFARELSRRTGAAVAFYTKGKRVASGAPEGFHKGTLDQIVSDLSDLEKDSDYAEKGRSKVRIVGGNLGVVYARLPGEAWQLGAGYAVGRMVRKVDGPFGFFQTADDKDKESVSLPIVIAIILGAALLGLLFSLLEHTRPLHVFRSEAIKLSKGEVDQLQPSKFRGVYRKIASDVNDGIDQVLAKGGTPRKGAVDLKQVMGDVPDQPQMSAFSFPGDAVSKPGAELAQEPAPEASKPKPKPPGPKPKPPGPKPAAAPAQPAAAPAQPAAAEKPAPAKPAPPKPGGAPKPPTPPKKPGAPKPPSPAAPASGPTSAPVSAGAPESAIAGDGGDEQGEWHRVYEEFVATKQQCGEKTEGFTFEKFKRTLEKNRDALIKRHGCKRVKFSVYVKDGKAALKASPIKE